MQENSTRGDFPSNSQRTLSIVARRDDLSLTWPGVEAAVSESLKIQISETLQSFECRMDELAQKCVERWRIAFAGGLNSLVRILGEQFVLQAAPDGNTGQPDSTDKPPSGARR